MIGSSDDDHRLSTSEEMMAKARWSSWKKVTNKVPVNTVLNSSKNGGDKQSTNDSSIWDNNDDAFIREVALERHHRLLQSPCYSESTLEEVSSECTSGPNSSSANEDQYNMTPFIISSSSFGLRRPQSGASTSLPTHGSASGGSDASSALTYPSPGSTKMELTGRNRTYSHQFSTSYEVSPTSASFSSREARQQSQSPSFERLHEGWTEETIEDEESSGLSSLPEERGPQWNDQYSPTFRRPSTGSVASNLRLNSATKTFPSLSSQQSIESSTATDYRLNKSSAHYNSFNTSPSTPKSQRGSIISGLKKKLGNFKSNNPRETVRLSPTSAWQSPRSAARDEVQIVSANIYTAPPSFAQFSFAGRIDSNNANQEQSPMKSTAMVAAPTASLNESRRNSRATSSNGHYADMKRPSVSNVHEKGSTIERLSSRMFGKNKISILQSRSSSRTSFIEHTSFDEARRPSNTPSIAGISLSSHHPFDHQDEEREELQGDCSPRSGSPLASMIQSPIRPARHDGSSSSLFLPKPTTSTRASLELNFNAAHDKRWSTFGPSTIQAERRGSDLSVNRVPPATRSGSNTSSFLAARLRRNQATAESATNSIYSNRRTSWQHNSPNSEPITLDRCISRASSSCSKRLSLRSQASQRVSEMIGGGRKQSLTGAQISRPTSLVSSSSASVTDHIIVAAASSSSFDNCDFNGAESKTIHQRRFSSVPFSSLDHLRQFRGVITARIDSSSPSPNSTLFRSVALDSPTYVMQQQQLSFKRPKFGLDLQLDAAAAFDSIPSPLVMRRASFNPTAPVGLSLLGIDDLHSRGDLTGGPSPLREVFPCTPAEQEGEKELFILTPGEEQEKQQDLHLQRQKSNSSHSSFLPSPRPPPDDTPQSPGLEEYELLDYSLNLFTTKDSRLQHSRSQDQIPWSSSNTSTIKDLARKESYQGRPRSISYSFI